MSAAISSTQPIDGSPDQGPSLQVGATLLAHWRLLIVGPMAAGALALGVTYLMDPIYTAKTTFLPPQQQQGAAAAALQSLGALASLAGGSGAVKTPGDQYVAFMQSVTVEDRIVDKFKLMEPAKAKYRFEARNFLRKSARIELGKKMA